MECRDRNREGGGVCIFITNDIAFNRRDDLCNDDIEFLAVDILLPKSKPILVSVPYRPPKEKHFYEKLEDLFVKSPVFTQQESYILGDFNTDFLAKKKTGLKCSFDNFLRIFDLKQLIREPTRITDTSKTCIDMICTSDPDTITQSGVLPCTMSDHNVIFCTR